MKDDVLDISEEGVEFPYGDGTRTSGFDREKIDCQTSKYTMYL